MKLEQVVILVVFAIVATFICQMMFDSFDELEFTYDPSTGRQSFKARKNRLLDEPEGMILEGN